METTALTPIQIFGWIIGGTLVAAATFSIISLTASLSRLKEAESLISQGLIGEALSKLNKSEAEEMEEKIKKLLPSDLYTVGYNQADSRWRYLTLTPSRFNMGNSGCYITSLADALQAKGTRIAWNTPTPENLLKDLIYRKKISSDGSLTSDCIEAFGYYLESDRSFSYNTAASRFGEGCIVVLVVKNGGHFVLMKGLASNGDIKIMDPDGGMTTYVNPKNVSGMRVYKRR